MKFAIMYYSRLLFLVVLVLAGCSSRVYHPAVSQETAVSRDNALIVMGVTWVERYNDTEEALEKKLVSADLLKDETRVRKLLAEKNGTVLNRPLHYLFRFQFQFETAAEEKHGFIRFDEDVREYEEIAIHELVPGRVRMNNIFIEQRHYVKKDHFMKDDDFRWKKHWFDYEEDYGTWELEAGKVTYMGHLTMYFKTRRFIFGFITPEELVDRTALVAIVIEDRFDEVRQQLKKEKPWFPVDEMINQAKPAKWIYLQSDFADFDKGIGPDTDKKKVIKRNKKKYFF